MEEARSIFNATDELLTSPLIQGYARMFDIALSLGQPRLVSLILPIGGFDAKLERTLIYFNPDLLDIQHASIYAHSFDRKAVLSLTIEARDIGVTGITICSDEYDETKGSAGAAYVPHFIKNRPMS